MTVLIVLVLLVIFLSFMSSLCESVILSVNGTHIEKLIQEKKKAARRLKTMKEHIDRSLSSILIVNTIVNTIGAIAIGAESVRVFGTESLFYISFFLTVAILVFSEIVPKSMGAHYWKELALLVTYYLRIIIFITYPLLKITDYITHFIKAGKSNSVINREDIVLMAHIGRRDGAISQWESEFITNFLSMSDTEVDEIMTPRTVMFSLDENMTIKEFYDLHNDCNFSRIPVYNDDDDNIVGFVMKSDIFKACVSENGDMKIVEFKRKIRLIPETLQISELLNLLINKKFQLALAVDEYGSITGLVTLEDAIEFMIGREIMDESDTVSDMRNLALQRWKKKILGHKRRKEIMINPTE